MKSCFYFYSIVINEVMKFYPFFFILVICSMSKGLYQQYFYVALGFSFLMQLPLIDVSIPGTLCLVMFLIIAHIYMMFSNHFCNINVTEVPIEFISVSCESELTLVFWTLC